VAQKNTPSARKRTNPNLRESWKPFRTSIGRILAPVERILAIEAASGIVLLVAAIAGLVLANSPWSTAYSNLWRISIGPRFGGIAFERDLHFWINEGLMTLFFFVVGLEIHREIHSGELGEPRRAALPLAAAMGGMLAPAVIFFALNFGRASLVGWAIPMATDIAFAVGVLALLGKRVSPTLRILVLALALVDDIGAIVVIALFYSTELGGLGFAILALGILTTYLMQYLNIRSPFAYIAPGLIIWAGAYTAGIHPTLAGVIAGFLTPVKPWYGAKEFRDQTDKCVRPIRSNNVDGNLERPVPDTPKAANRALMSPSDRLLYTLHGWVAFGIMPLFAFANAGVPLGRIDFGGDARWLFYGVLLGLTIGKPVGIVTVSWLAARFGLVEVPKEIRWSHVGVVGIVGGIGFTMSLFIAQLAFPEGEFLETSKLAILSGSLLAGILSMVSGYKVLIYDRQPSVRD
jgi:NhaA family Na+:H+ antiporter